MNKSVLAYVKYNSGVPYNYSTDTLGRTTAGYGRLSEEGLWEYPLLVNQRNLAVLGLSVADAIEEFDDE